MGIARPRLARVVYLSLPFPRGSMLMAVFQCYCVVLNRGFPFFTVEWDHRKQLGGLISDVILHMGGREVVKFITLTGVGFVFPKRPL